MKITYVFAFVSMLATAPLFARENPYLAAQMKAISADVDQITLVTTKPAAQIKDSQVTLAVARCRTTIASLQAILDNKDGDLSAPVIDDETDSGKKAELQKQFGDFLNAAITDVKTIFTQLKAQFAITDATQRDFTAVGSTLADLSTQEQNAHAIFNPQE